MNDTSETTTEEFPRLSRRAVLKTAGATTAGGILFSGVAAGSDDTAIFDIECLGDKVAVTLNEVELFGGGTVDPTTLDGLKVFLGTFENINLNDNNRVDVKEIEPCFPEGKTGTCPSPVAEPKDSETFNSSIRYVFDRSEAGLDGPVDGYTSNEYPDSVVLAGIYEKDDGSIQAFDSYGELQSSDVSEPNVVTFDPEECCVECTSGSDALVKYEWGDEDDDGDDEFYVEEGGDNSIELVSVTLDEDGEPREACFKTTYCDVDVVVKAGPDYEVTEIEGAGEFCVDGIDGRAISNIRFYCEAPDDLSVGNGRGK